MLFRSLDDRARGSVMNSAEYESNTCLKQKESAFKQKLKPKRLPVYDAPAAAGAALPLLTDDYAMDWAENAPDDASFGIKIRGDSMIPVIENGAVVWVKKQSTLEPGEIGIFILNGESLCKRLEYRNGGCYLISENSAYNPIRIYDTDELHVAGRVILQ
ncbi:LexA repressor [bioreactor metagenome]|uniref:LexA repressor n=1 Tax=bioreactor metagenome TaxID=1076179 RepID=A0A645HAK3_9ZZZZ